MTDIVREGAPILRKKAKPLQFPLSPEDYQRASSLLTYLKNSQDKRLSQQYQLREGVGLAANQIGWDKQVFAVYFMDEQNRQLAYIFCNPKMTNHSSQMVYLEQGEACLSVDREVKGYVPRYEQITVQAFTPDGHPFKLKLKGYAAIVIQHELDHLHGVMFYDHINKMNPFQLPNVESIRPIS
ncbi:peptide deformylase [Paenibacillus sp. N3.4]|uniref:peptide deformylase n=1 Tax=Paenibacillus sp. N3.4 TaxID=2603222 RepID=UPI0021C30C16|nr:peptide deformylase [Paenibacillus sp. N3.4]